MNSPDDKTYICSNCEKKWKGIQHLDPIEDLRQRIDPGEPYPAGQCPDCGCLVHVDEPNWKQVVEDILGQKTILPTLLNINSELDGLIEKELTKC